MDDTQNVDPARLAEIGKLLTDSLPDRIDRAKKGNTLEARGSLEFVVFSIRCGDPVPPCARAWLADALEVGIKGGDISKSLGLVRAKGGIENSWSFFDKRLAVDAARQYYNSMPFYDDEGLAVKKSKRNAAKCARKLIEEYNARNRLAGQPLSSRDTGTVCRARTPRAWIGFRNRVPTVGQILNWWRAEENVTQPPIVELQEIDCT